MKPVRSKLIGKRMFFGLLLLGVVGKYLFDSNRPTHPDLDGRPVLSTCSETVHGKFQENGEVDNPFEESRTCSQGIRRAFNDYVIVDNNVYWMSKSSHKGSACITGTGDTVGLVHNLASWDCWTAKPMQINQVEERDLYLAARYSPAFRQVEDVETPRPYWQSKQVEAYAMDDDHVYLRGRRLKGISPLQFKVIFPFGEDQKWQIFYVVQSNGSTYVGGHDIGDTDLSQFQALPVRPCPKHAIAECTGFNYPKDVFDPIRKRNPILGRIGNDVVLLTEDGVTHFADMASPDTFVFASSKHVYLYTRDKFYEFALGWTDSESKLIPLDTQRLEQDR